MKRNYNQNVKNIENQFNSKTLKEQTEQKPKSNSKVYCMECGSSHGTMHKIKKSDGSKGYLCQFCFDEWRNN